MAGVFLFFMIRLELVNKDNFDQVLDLEVAPKDQRRVASVEYSLAQAWLYRDSEDLFPYAVKSGQANSGISLVVLSAHGKQLLYLALAH